MLTVKIIKHCAQRSTLHLTHLETFRRLWWRLFTGKCRMSFLINYDSSLFSPVLVIIYSMSLTSDMQNWHGTLGLGVTNGWYSLSNLSGNLAAKVFFEIGVAQTSKISALFWSDTLESNEVNGILFDAFFPYAEANADLFLNCCGLLFLNVTRWVDRDSRNWRLLISFGTWYILSILAWRISPYIWGIHFSKILQLPKEI